jgi:Erythromycin biosynthesis protein CIII-like, C-terminal domain
VARILLAWELGGDYGHLMRFLTLARELQRRGHEPVFALRELTHVDAVLGDEPFRVFQAPIFVANVSGLPAAIGFAETLMRLGFVHPSTLTALCRGWRTLMEAIAPDLAVFDYAPTGLLATRGLGVPRMLFGSSFSVPPRTEPMPIYRWWAGENLARVLASERVVLAKANEVLARLGQAPMARLSDLLDADEVVIAASADFDQYPGRTGATYWGSVANLDKGVSPPWPIVGAKRVFAYLKPHYPDFEKLLKALRTIDAAVVIHAPGVAANLVRSYTAANVAFSEEPVRMADVRRECHLGICHAGVGTVEALITAGKPVLALPQHLEQMMTGKRLASIGAGLVVDPQESASRDYGRILRRLLDEPSFTAAAQAVADRHVDDDPAARVARIADRCETLIKAA